MQTTCYGCFKAVSVAEQKNIFDENLWIPLDDDYENNGRKSSVSSKQLKLNYSIELITGLKITYAKNQSVIICDQCLQSIRSYINFRARLLFSLRSLNNDDKVSRDASCSNIESTNTSRNKKDNRFVENVNSVDSRVPNESVPIENVLNIFEIDAPADFAADSNYSADSISGIKNEEENNDLYNIESYNENLNFSMPKEIASKIKDNDIESEVDVCSGEDDEVMELDSQCKRDEIVEINTSSESDIEVCDYEPAGKRIKSYNTFSPGFLS